MHEINYKGGVLEDPPENEGKNWLFGGKDRPVINESGDWTKYLPNDELQATQYFDPYSCVSESAETNTSTVLFQQMSETNPKVKAVLEMLGCLDDNGKVNFSGRFVAVGSGTIPGRGNSQYAVFEYIRKNGLVGEKHWPSKGDMTEDEYFAPVPQKVKDLGKKFLEYFSFEYEDVGSSNAELKEALKRSPLCVVVGGLTIGAEDLYKPVSIPVNYNHQLVLYNQENNVNRFSETLPVLHCIFDTYAPFRKKFVGNYPFKFAKAIFITLKKTLNMKYKIFGKSAIFLLDPVEKKLVPYGSGKVYKTVEGNVNYEDIKEVPSKAALLEIAPLADWMITSSDWDSEAFLSSI